MLIFSFRILLKFVLISQSNDFSEGETTKITLDKIIHTCFG